LVQKKGGVFIFCTQGDHAPMFTATAIEMLRELKRQDNRLPPYDVSAFDISLPIFFSPFVMPFLPTQDAGVRAVVEEMGVLFETIQAALEYPLC
jgi:hypothetical protein